MDHYSILDRSYSQASPEPGVLTAAGSGTASVSAGIAANALLRNPGDAKLRSPERDPGEEANTSLAEMAQADLDAALQLLAERAQYITGATGAAIALRKGDYKEMRCRATSGSNVPQLGSLLSTEHGLSGECVRTSTLLHCKDAERDSRVNREVCRTLGIASVVVMPVVSEQKVLGVFEVLSDKTSVFSERDLSALARLSEMVGTAVKHAVPAQAVAPASIKESERIQQNIAAATPTLQPESTPPAVTSPSPAAVPSVVTGQATVVTSQVQEAPSAKTKEAAPEKEEASTPIPKKRLFWSTVVRSQGSAAPKLNSEKIAVPPVLRGFQKCQACGFPVSPSRTFCVECEEKQWRGQPVAAAVSGQPETQPALSLRASAAAAGATSGAREISQPQISPGSLATLPPPASVEPVAPPETSSLPTKSEISADEPFLEISASFLSSTLQSESWFAANKYVLGALLAVAITIAAVAFLR